MSGLRGWPSAHGNCAGRAVLPSYAADADAFAAAVVDFVRQHSVRMVLPNGDGSIASLIPRRDELAALGCVLALAPNAGAGDRQQQGPHAGAREQAGIDQPRTMRIDSVADLPSVFAELRVPLRAQAHRVLDRAVGPAASSPSMSPTRPKPST